jgi:hypothetical protein
MLEDQGYSIVFLALGSFLLSIGRQWNFKTTHLVACVVVGAAIKIKLENRIGGTNELLESNDLYVALGSPRHSTPFEIRTAYKAVSKLYHPDKNHGPDAEFVWLRIKFAYDILMDPQQRDIYNRFGEDVLGVDPRFDELMLLSNMFGYYLFLAFMVYISTMNMSARVSRTWITIVGIVMFSAEAALSLTSVELPSNSMLPFLTEHQLIIFMHSVFPALTLILRCVAESYHTDVDAVTSDILQQINLQYVSISRAMGLVSKALRSGSTTQSEKEEILAMRAKVESEITEDVQMKISQLKAAASDDPLEKHYWIIVIIFYACMYYMRES